MWKLFVQVCQAFGQPQGLRMAKNKVRLNLDLPESSIKKLDLLKKNRGASSKSEIIRDSIRVLHEIETAKKNGSELILKGKDGKEVAICFL